MAHKLISSATALHASQLVKVPRNARSITLRADYKFGDANNNVTAVTVKWQGGRTRDYEDNGVVTSPTLAAGSTAENWKTGTFIYRIDGTTYTKTTVAAGAAFTAAHVVAADKWGVVFCYINAAGTVSTYVNASSQTGTQSYTTYALAAAVDPPSSTITGPHKCYLGKIIIEADGTTWTAKTDDLTPASDLEGAAFESVVIPYNDIVTHTFSSNELTARTATWHVTDQFTRFGRAVLSTLTGTTTGVDVWVEFNY